MTLPYNGIMARLEALAACLCAEIEDPANGVPGVCFCGVVPGDQPPAVYSGNCSDACGMAWVRLVTMYPATGVGIAESRPIRCDPALGVDVEVGMLRCMSVGDERGNLPSLEEQHDAVALQMADSMVMLKALLCCDAFGSEVVIVGQYQPVGPQGGLVGGVFVASMGA